MLSFMFVLYACFMLSMSYCLVRLVLVFVSLISRLTYTISSVFRSISFGAFLILSVLLS